MYRFHSMSCPQKSTSRTDQASLLLSIPFWSSVPESCHLTFLQQLFQEFSWLLRLISYWCLMDHYSWISFITIGSGRSNGSSLFSMVGKNEQFRQNFLKALNPLFKAKMNDLLPKVFAISSCAEDDSYFEPLSDNYLVHFTRLMELYQSKSEEDLHD